MTNKAGTDRRPMKVVTLHHEEGLFTLADNAWLRDHVGINAHAIAIDTTAFVKDLRERWSKGHG